MPWSGGGAEQSPALILRHNGSGNYLLRRFSIILLSLCAATPRIETHPESPFAGLAGAENLDGTACLKPKPSIYHSRFDSLDCHACDHSSGSRCIGRDTSMGLVQHLPVAPSQSSQQRSSLNVIVQACPWPLAFPSCGIPGQSKKCLTMRLASALLRRELRGSSGLPQGEGGGDFISWGLDPP